MFNYFKNKRKVFFPIILLFVFFTIGCNSDNTKDDNNIVNRSTRNFSNNEEAYFDVKYDYDYARDKALFHLSEMDINDIEDNWKGAELGEGFYWYNPMTGNKPAYIEFKVMRDGKDQGYITVSLTEADYTIPEYHTEGLTTYEYLRDMVGTKDIKGIRFSPFDYVGETKDNNEKNRKFFGTLSYLNDTTSETKNREYNEFLGNYKEKRKEMGGINGSKESLNDYYKKIKDKKQSNTRGIPPRYTISKEVEESDKLPTYNQFTIYFDSQNNIYTYPISNPTKISSSGCTPTAGAIVLAYWYRKYHKTNFFVNPPALFDANIGNNEKVVILRLGQPQYMATDYQGNSTQSGGGWTNRGIIFDAMRKYINYFGYSCSTSMLSYNPKNIYSWGNEMYSQISQNMPPILSYNEGGAGHSVVVYKITFVIDRLTNIYEVYCGIITGGGDGAIGKKTVNTINNEFYIATTINIF